jgi:hypothetical protein
MAYAKDYKVQGVFNMNLVLFMGAQTLTFPIYIDNLLLIPIVQRLWHLCCLCSLWASLKFALKMHTLISLLKLGASCTSIFTYFILMHQFL